jgi:cell division protein FtsB
MKQHFIFLILLVIYNFSSAQSKKEEIQLLNQLIDSLKIAYTAENARLTNQIHDLRANISELQTKLNTTENKLTETKDLQSQTKRNYDNIKNTRFLDSIKYTNEIDQYVKKVNKIYDSIHQSKLFLSNWFMRNLNISIPNASAIQTTIPDLSNEVKTELLEQEYWLANVKVTEIDYIKQGIKLDLSDENYVKRLFLNSDYLIVSYHLTAGSDGHSILIDLKQMTSTFLESLFVNEIDSNGSLIVEKDYYDDEGHVWETGSYDVKSQRYRMISKEH